jgi:hypothetical protein
MPGKRHPVIDYAKCGKWSIQNSLKIKTNRNSKEINAGKEKWSSNRIFPDAYSFFFLGYRPPDRKDFAAKGAPFSVRYYYIEFRIYWASNILDYIRKGKKTI